MTIKELENRTGMTRANIRFYEGEGLLSPKRLGNGYRDYSEEDARTLEKIKLLRQLQLDIDTIRKVQGGALTLEQTLFTQVTRLEGDKATLERAAQVCRELERSGVDYAALEPQPWLRQLQAPERPAMPEPSVPSKEWDDEPQACYHPWMRLLARSLDVALYDTLINVAWLLASRNLTFVRLQTGNIIGQWVSGLLALILALLLEPLWLRLWGWTPGKWLFGLKLRDENGEKLTLSQAQERCFRLLWEGYALTIPILQLWTMWQGRKAGLEGQDCPWDREEGYRYTKVERGLEVMLYIEVRALCVAALALSMQWATLPPNRGDLTVAEFARNYDHLLTQLMDQNVTAPTLDEEGRWKDLVMVNGSLVVHREPGISVATNGSGYVVSEGDNETTVWDEPEYAVTDGRVTAVTLHMESNQNMLSDSIRESLVFLAMSGAVDGLNLFNYGLSAWAEMADQTFALWADVDVDYRGLHISQRVEYTGYQVFGGMLLYDEGEVHRCEKTVTISLIE